MVEESMARAGIEEMELDESNPPRDDFLWWSYHVSGEKPAAWQVSAKHLLAAAMAVKAKVHPFENAMDPLARIEAMLLGMALECILKGMYIRRRHALVKDGEYVGVKDAGAHQLLQFADAAGVTLSQPERSILTRLTDFIKYAGRYPISKRVKDMEPVKTPDGHTVERGYISGAELERAETLTNRLMQEVGPWR